MKFFIRILIFFSCFTITEAQSLKIGFRLEPGVLIIEQNDNEEYLPTLASFYVHALFEPFEFLTFEIRPGYLFTGDEYTGFEIGAYARYKIPHFGLYIIAGLNNHSNGGSGHNGGGSYEKEILYKAFGIGFQKDKLLSADLIFYWTNNKDFAYSFVTERINKRMEGIVKLGLSFAWDVF